MARSNSRTDTILSMHSSMAERGPTQGAERHSAKLDRWHSRPWLARLLRATIIFAPLLGSIVFTWQMGRSFPPDRLGINKWLWVAGVFVAANLLLYVLSKLSRRLMPLVLLMKLTLVFPDNAPSRTKAALRNSNSKKMLREIEAAKLSGDSAKAELYGHYLVQLLAEVNDHDRLTRGHSERVRTYSELLGEELGLGDHDMNLLRWSALLHDVGKLTVPKEILNKDGRPTDDEWKLLQGHPAASRSLLEPLRPWLGEWVHAADQHHCRWDGKGYPDDLAGSDISVAGRLVAIADAFDVMTSARSYKKPLSADLARQELTACAGTQFDPMMVRAFLQISLGRLQAVAGPWAWLANLTGSAQIPAPTISVVATSTWSAAVAVVGLVTVAVSGQPVDPPVAQELPMAAPLTTTTTRPGLSVPPTTVGPVTTIVPTTRPTTTTVESTTTIQPSTSAPPASTTTTQPTTTTTAAPATVPPVVNQAPTANNDSSTIVEDARVLKDVLANDTDPDGDSLSVTSVGNPPNGTASIQGGWVEYVPDQDFFGSEDVTYTISDGFNPSVTGVFRVTVTPINDPPTASATDTSIDEDVSVGQAVLQITSADVDGDTLGFAITAGDPTGRFAITPGGQVQVAAALDHESQTSYSIEVTVSDADFDVVAAATVTVADVDEDPTAGDDSSATDEDTPVSFNLAANDSDPENQTLTWNPQAASDQGGTITHVGSTINYSPPADYFGADSFTYTVSDPAGNTSAPATVTVVISPINDRPSANADAGTGYGTTEDVAFTTADVTDNDTDIEDTTVASSTAVLGTDAAKGSVVSNGDGTFTYTPNQDTNGSDWFTYIVTDSSGEDSDPATVTVTVAPANDPPAASNDVLSVDSGGSATTIDVRLNDSDVEGDALVVTVVTNGTNGAVVHNGDGTMTYTHDGSQTLSDSFTYTVEDPSGATDTATITVTINPTQDGDAIPATSDVCPYHFDPLQEDTDGDGIGDVCDPSPTATSPGTFVDSGQSVGGTGKNFAVALGDIDGDGDLDAVFASRGDGNKVEFNDGTGSFTDSGQTLGSDDSDGVALGDIDGDGDLDVVFANYGPDTVWINNGSGVFSDSGQSLGVNDTADVVLGDFDLDGDLDLATGVLDGDNKIWRNNGLGAFSDSGQNLGAEKATAAATADIDGDGDLDLVYAHENENNTVWLNNGSGVFTDSGQVLGSNKSHDVALADLDGDGDLDILFGEDTDSDTVWLNNGNGVFTDTGQALGNSHTHTVALGDIDGDGDIDAFLADHTDANSVWTNNGNGVFTDSGQSLSNRKTEGIALGDVNGDSRLDAVAANDGSPGRVWIN